MSYLWSVAPPPPFPIGEPLLKSKKAKLPLDMIMRQEKNGGWGRSVKGSGAVVKKLRKTMEFAHYALDLLAHLDLVAKARRSQAMAISWLEDDVLEEILQSLQRAKVDLHPATTNLLLQRRAQRLVEIIGKANTNEHVDQRLEELMDVTNPFATKVVGDFDPFHPRLANLPGCASKTERFSHIVVKELLIAMITTGESKASLAHKFAEHVISSYSFLDMLPLTTSEAQCVTDLLDIARVLRGILGSLMDAVRYNAGIMTIKESFDAFVSESLVALVALAVKQHEYYKAKVGLFINSEPALAVVAPLIHKSGGGVGRGLRHRRWFAGSCGAHCVAQGDRPCGGLSRLQQAGLPARRPVHFAFLGGDRD